MNDNPPIFTSDTFHGSVDEGSNVTTPVLQVVAQDADTGMNQLILYSLDTSTPEGALANTYLQVCVLLLFQAINSKQRKIQLY